MNYMHRSETPCNKPRYAERSETRRNASAARYVRRTILERARLSEMRAEVLRLRGAL